MNPNDSTISETYNSDYIDISVKSSLSDEDLTEIQPDKPIKEVKLPYDYKNIEKEIERKTTRSMVDLETWVDKVSYDWKSFFKVLSDED